MADRIKGITIEIDGDTSKLSKALKDVNAELKTSQNNLKDIDKLLKLDPGNTELLTQKYKNLGNEVEAAKKKLETLKEASAQMEAAGQTNTAEWDNLQREIIETEQNLRSLTEEFRNFGSVSAQQIAAAGEKLKDAGSKVEGIGKAIMPASAAVAGLGAAAVKTASDFDTGMSSVQAITGATGKDLDALREKAKEMGAKTAFSATEAASAMEYMAMAGWKTEDMLGGIEGIMNLAAASGEDLALTSDIVTDALTAFGLSASDSAHFADVLAAASSNANTNVSMMGETFKYAAPVAGALGFSVEDTAVAIGLMGNAGIKASQAGTSLRGILTALTGEIELSGAALGDVTIQTTNADGTMRELSDILGDCRAAFSQLSESEAASAAEALVGKNAMSGFLALMNAGEADVAKLTNAINSCSGSAEQMANVKLDNLEGQITLLKSQLETLAISFGEIIMPVVISFVGHLQNLLEWLNNLSEGQKKVITVIGAVIAVAGPLLVMIGKFMIGLGQLMTFAPKLVSAFGTVKTLITTVGGALKGLWAILMANPITLVIAAVAALVAAFVYAWNNVEGFKEFWINLWETIKEACAAFGEKIKEIWSSIVEAASAAWETIKNAISVALQMIGEIISAALQIILMPWMFIWENCKEYIFAAWEWIKEKVSAALDAIRETIASVWNAIVSVLAPILETLKNAVSAAWEWIKEKTSAVFEAVKGVVSSVWNAIKGVVTSVLKAIKSAASTAWNAVKNTVSSAVNAVKSVVSSGLNAAKNTVSSVLGAIKSKFSSIWEGVKSIVSGAIEKIKSFMNFKWELPKLKLPHFSISGKFSLNPPSVPHFSIDWYKKAMADGMILNSPTIFGAAGGKFLGGGEAGPEAVVGVSSLRSMISDAVAAASGGGGDITIPVYIGSKKLETIVVSAVQRSNYRSGGR